MAEPADEPAPADDQRGAVRRGPGGSSPAGSNSPVRAFALGRGHAVLRGPGRGRLRLGRRGHAATSTSSSPTAPSLLGHAHPVVVEAVRAAAADGHHLRRADRGRGAAGRGASATGSPGCEQVRLVSVGHRGGHDAPSGWPAGAPAGTGSSSSPAATTGTPTRCWPAGGSGVATLGLPGSAGVPAAAVADTVVAPYNVVPELDDDVACVIVEPVAANMGLVAPGAGLPRGPAGRVRRRRRAARSSTRSSPASGSARRGATAASGVTPDLWCFGKVIGGGLPVGAFGGRRDVMDVAGPARARVPGRHAVGEPAGHRGRAGRARAVLDAGGYQRAGRASRGRLGAGPGRRPWPAAGLDRAGAGGRAAGRPVLRRRPGRRLRGGPGVGGDRALPARSSTACSTAGVALAPGPYEVMFPSLAHGDADIRAHTVEAAGEAARIGGRRQPAVGGGRGRRAG